MAVVIGEPHAMAMSRSTASNNFQDKDNIDYRMLPRSSGDGMEHAGSHIEPTNTTIHSTSSRQSYKTSPIYTLSDENSDRTSQKYTIQSSEILSSQNKTRTHNVPEPHIVSDANNLSYDRKNSSDYTRKNTFKSHEDLLSSRDESGTSLSLNNSLYDTSYLEEELFDLDTLDESDNRKATLERTVSIDEVFEIQNTIKDLEERNAKLVEEKTKLCVQLGLQTEVNAELKRLVVAALGEDLENSLESLLMKNAQGAVEIKHWKTLSEEYAEESDKLAIECDVWRTKFMASRMMSDELSTWKTTLYTKYKQTQSALQRLLNEREELKRHLMKTKRLLHIHNGTVNHDSAPYKQASENFSDHNVGQQSVLELASVINCLVQDLTTNLFGETQNVSLPEEVLTEDSNDKQKVEPTPGEKLAIQVLTSDVELQPDEQPDNSAVMKRLGKQYIGNSYHSRLMTNSFRVTYDCCDRCKGAVQVV